jgi:hypothetical protein
VTFEFDEQERLALAARTGGTKPASYSNLVNFVESCARATLAEVVNEYEKEQEQEG